MTTQRASAARTGAGVMARLNGPQHRVAVNLFMVIVIAHWVEHLAQAFQIWALNWPIPESRGVLGLLYPWLVTSEWLHYAYALVMLIGLYLLRNGFHGRARTWWLISFGIQFWHHIEHLLLFLQAQTGVFLFGAAAPTSIAQLVIPRVELHLFYNTVVFVPMVIAMWRHLRPSESERSRALCSCAAPLTLATIG
ncbi:MAG: hypothetical protein ACRDT8_04205 [Micromonosporaceae bacterium]